MVRAQSPSVDAKQQQQERLAQKRRAKAERSQLITRLFFGLFGAIVFGVPAILTLGIKVGLGVGLLFPIILLCYCYPRTALWVFLIYMPFSGTVTYWIGGGGAVFQLAKDAFYFPALLGLIQECKRKGKAIVVSKPLLFSFLFLVTASLLTLFIVNGSKQFFLPACSSIDSYNRLLRDANGELLLAPNGLVIPRPCRDDEVQPFLQGLIGLKVLLGYIPLIFAAYYLIKDRKTLIFLGRLLLTLAIICCVLGIIQYGFLKTGRCKGTVAEGGYLFKASLQSKCFVGGSLLYTPSQNQIRLPGTFVSPWHWGWFLVANSAICFSVAFSDPSLLWRGLGLAGMSLVFINGVICGQRLAFLGVPAFFIIQLILTGQAFRLKRLIPVVGGLGILVLVGFSFFNPDFIQQRVDSFVDRWNRSPPYALVVEQLNFAIENQKGFLGYGLGTATNSARIFGEISLIETFHSKLLFEMGWLGLTAFMVFITHINVITFRKYAALKDPILRNFAGGFWVFLLVIGYMPYWYPLDTDPVCVYYWLFVGILLKLPLIDREEADKKQLLSENRGETDEQVHQKKPRGRKGWSIA